jgi:hypothetical protein
MLYPDTEEEWLNMEVLEQLQYPVLVLERMWWLTPCEEVDKEGNKRAVVHVVTITAENSEGFTILFGSGLSMEVEKSTVLKEIDVHNDIVLNVNRVKTKEVPPETPAVSQSEILTQTLSPDNVGGECNKTITQQGKASITANLPLPPPPPLDLDLLLPKSGAEVTVERATELLKAARIVERLRKKREREEIEGEFSVVGTLKKKLKTAQALKRAEKESRAKNKTANKQMDDDTQWNDMLSLPTKKIKAKYTRLDIWQLGNKAARERKNEQILKATVPTLTDARLRLQEQGWAVMNDWGNSLCDGTCNPTVEQAEYILQTNEDNKVVLFEGAVLHDSSSVIDLETKKDKLGGRARYQLKPSGHSGQWGKRYVEYQRKYKQQLACIISGMYADEPAGDPDAWQLNLNSIVGGVCHQHPHCDAGRVGTYQGLPVFPFVALHGFGIHPFSVWILPQGFEYGFMHTFQPDQILFMRGDFVHAGVPSTIPRGHMEFFPLHAAGWQRRNPFWLRPAADTTFAWQNPTFPFAYPDVGTPNEQGSMVVNYPVATTEALQLPLKNEASTISKKVRLAMKKRMSAQLIGY